MELNDAVLALAALAQATRLSIYSALIASRDTEVSAGALADTLNVPAATLSFHLRELSHARLVTARQEGRFIFYTANRARMNALIRHLTENYSNAKSPASTKKKARSDGSRLPGKKAPSSPKSQASVTRRR